jgi:hypothetical protein
VFLMPINAYIRTFLTGALSLCGLPSLLSLTPCLPLSSPSSRLRRTPSHNTHTHTHTHTCISECGDPTEASEAPEAIQTPRQG